MERAQYRMSFGQVSSLYWLLPSLLLFAACSARDAAREHSFKLTLEGGVEHAVTTGGPRYTEPLFEYERVGTFTEDESVRESLLGSISRVLMDEHGYIYVEDWGAKRIAVFAPDGRYSHAIGDRGQGPGEFESLVLLSVSGGVVTVWDGMLYRTTRFRTDGSLLQIYKCPQTISPDVMHLGPDGLMIGIGQIMGAWMMERVSDQYAQLEAVVVDAGGDTTCYLETPRVLVAREFYIESLDVGSVATIHFKGFPIIRYVPDVGLLMTTGEEPIVEYYSLHGELERVIRIEMERERVTREERSVLMAESRALIEESEDERTRAVRQRRHELMEIPDTKDFWDYLQVDDAGFMWLMRMADYTKSPDERTAEFIVLSPEGEYLGDTSWPDEDGNLSKGHLICIEMDEETGGRVGVVYRIRPAVAGLEYP